MQIALTKKISDVIGIRPGDTIETNPLFCWTANWTNTFSDRKEDMVVMVNNATRFTVAIYGVRRNQFKDIEAKMLAAIRNTFLSMNINHEVIEEYMQRAGEVSFAANRDPKLTAWVNKHGRDLAFVVGRIVNESYDEIKYEDTFGRIVSEFIVGYSANKNDSYFPAEEMKAALAELTGKPIYKYRAFELLVTLDLDIYKATRRLIVPADLEFSRMHELIQRVFNWNNHSTCGFINIQVKRDQ
jgi:hypothetical protein